ncbi:MAG: hypothetical protein GY874_06445 [Desulfobacteraceae bacterium]|nr:hypothetical protein [Desulfobacteraceae bacterium]
MENSNILLLITPIPLLSIIIWIILLVLAMYLARKPFHRCMASFSRIIYNAMRMAAISVQQAGRKIEDRNREVLLAAGLEMAERNVEREFERISNAIQRDLSGYPKLQRNLSENLKELEEDYKKCDQIPHSLPDWAKVIDAIAKIKPSGDRVVVNMLDEIHGTLKKQHKAVAERHRKDVHARHGILGRMLPVWHKLHITIDSLEKGIKGLTQRSKKIDHYMESYEKIQSQVDMPERQLASSSLSQFFISSLVLAVAGVGAIINFNLVALPMSEMVGGASYIGELKTSDVAGMFIVCMEIVVGIFLMDALRITRLFTIIGSMDDRKRKIICWVLFMFLTLLAGVESALAFYRDRLASDMEVLRQSLAGIDTINMPASRIPMIGQMIMGFILPFILTFVAIPFESFLCSSRTLLGILTVWTLRFLTLTLRMAGNISFYIGRLIVNIYDLIIFPGLWIESSVLQKLRNNNESGVSALSDERDQEQIQTSLAEEPVICKKKIK